LSSLNILYSENETAFNIPCISVTVPELEYGGAEIEYGEKKTG
jgi:hypothetical protein